MRSLIFVVALLFASHARAAEDVESLLDVASSAKKASANTNLVYVLQTLIPEPTPEQSVFFRTLESDDWRKSLIQYAPAFEGTPFQKSANGQALLALAQFKSGMPVVGLESLFSVEKPREVHPEIRRMWKEAAPDRHPAWTRAIVKWDPGFAEIFPAEVEFIALTRNVGWDSDLAELRKLFNRLPSNRPERGRVGWLLTLKEAEANHLEEAAKVLAAIFPIRPTPVSLDLMNVTAARLLYQRAFFSAAIKYYEKIPRASELWPQAQEEMAWAYARKGEPQNAVAVTRGLLVPSLAAQVGPETFFVHSLALLRLCDYTGVLTALGEFPKRYRDRLEALKRLAADTRAAPVNRLFERWRDGGRVAWIDLGADSKSLPRLITRDDQLSRLAHSAAILETEAKVADEIYSQALSLSGAQGVFDRMKTVATDRARRAAADAHDRVKRLALAEADDIRRILRKLHILEAEVIQQMGAAERTIASERPGSTGTKARDKVEFPVDKEVWFDEIGNYRVDVKRACRGGKAAGAS